MPSVMTDVDAPATVVWRLVSDVTRMGEWSPETTSAAWLEADAAPTAGARFKGRNRRRAAWSTTCTVTAAVPGREFAFMVGKGETLWRYAISDQGDRCMLTESFEIIREPGVLGRWLTRLATGVPWSRREADLVDAMESTLDRIKAVAEAEAAPE